MEIKSEYLEQFAKVGSLLKLSGNKILVERVETTELKTKGGIIIAERADIRSDVKSMKPLIAIVIATGEGYLDVDTNETVPMETKAGAVVMLNPNGVSFFSSVPALNTYGDMKIGITTESDIQMSFENVEAFNKYAAIINN